MNIILSTEYNTCNASDLLIYTVHILTRKDYRRKKQTGISEAPNKQQIIESNGKKRPDNLSTPKSVNKLARFKFMVSRYFHTLSQIKTTKLVLYVGRPLHCLWLKRQWQNDHKKASRYKSVSVVFDVEVAPILKRL